MKIAHVCNYAPGLSGMYGSVRDLVLAEKKCNVTAEFIDDEAFLDGHVYIVPAKEGKIFDVTIVVY